MSRKQIFVICFPCQICINNNYLDVLEDFFNLGAFAEGLEDAFNFGAFNFTLGNPLNFRPFDAGFGNSVDFGSSTDASEGS